MQPIKLIPLHVGRAEVWASGAENHSVHLTYDVSNYLKAWPDAQPSVAFERADGERYAHAWEMDGPVLHVPLLLADTEIPGMCKCMITMLSGDGRANTVVFYGSVTEGIDSLGEEPTDPMLGVIEQVNAAAVRAETAADRAEGAGGDSSMFVIHVTNNVADKTAAEITKAIYTDKKVPIVYDTITGTMKTLVRETGRGYLFSHVYYDHDNNRIVQMQDEIKSDGTVTSNAFVPVPAQNPYKLKLTGAVNAEYDGSEAVTVNIPAGGSGGSVDQVQADWNESDPTSKAYVKNRTHWVEPEEVVVMPETTFTADTLTENGWPVTQPLDGLPATGENCTVVWNGTEYECPVQSYDMDGVPMSFIGDGIALGGADIGLTGNGEPFAIVAYPTEVGAEAGFYAAMYPIDGSTTATVAIKVDGEVVHPLDPKFFGAMRCQKKIIITINENGSIVTDTPFSEAWALDEGALQAALCVRKVYTSTNNRTVVSTQAAFAVSRLTLADNNAIQFSIEALQDTQNRSTDLYTWYSIGHIARDLTFYSLPGANAVGDYEGFVKQNVGNAPYIQPIAEAKRDLGISALAAENAGKLLYIDANGNAQPLTLGAGLKIEGGVLMLNIKTGNNVSLVENDDGSVTLNGAEFEPQDDGSVLVNNATFTEQDDGSVLIN